LSSVAASSLLRVEGTIRHGQTEASLEYSVSVQVRDAQGVIVARHVVGVGAIHPGDTRTFALHVEARPSEESVHAAAAARMPQTEREKRESSSPSRPQEARKREAPSSARPPSRPK
jgi:hypothetical protein